MQFNRQALELSEWVVHTPLVRPGSPAHLKSAVCLQLRRAPWYYVRHVYLVLCLLSSLGLVAFLVDSKEEQAARASISLTLLLTSVAFKFSINERLPAVPYETLMDSYISACNASLALMTVLCVLPSFVDDDVLRFRVNLALALLCAAIQSLVSVWWIGRGLLIGRTRESTKQVKVSGERHNWYCYHYRVSEHLSPVTAESSVFLGSARGTSLSPPLEASSSKGSGDSAMPGGANASLTGDHHSDSMHAHTSNKYGALETERGWHC